MMFFRPLLFGVTAVIACDLLPRGDVEPRAALAVVDSACDASFSHGPLPRALSETSGIAVGSSGRVWTHNDGSDATLYALDAGGRVTQRVRVGGARLTDWEDIESAPCEDGLCLYIADTGDNNGRRGSIAVHVLREPAAGSSSARVAATFRARYPGAPHDAEALFVLPGGRLFIVTKGRHGTIDLFRFPVPLRPSETMMLQHVRRLAPQPADAADRITAATATPDGASVVLRTHRALYVYDAAALVGGQPVSPRRIDLQHLQHEQGEAVAVTAAGEVWLTSESEKAATPVWARLTCRLTAPPGG